VVSKVANGICVGLIVEDLPKFVAEAKVRGPTQRVGMGVNISKLSFIL
jgi:hypothetical protein